jgi:hypothetical protein
MRFVGNVEHFGAALQQTGNLYPNEDLRCWLCLDVGGDVRPSYRSQPYEFGGGILFSFEHEGRIRDVFVPPDLLSTTGRVPSISEALDYVERHTHRFIAAARQKAARSNPLELLMLDPVDH